MSELAFEDFGLYAEDREFMPAWRALVNAMSRISSGLLIVVGDLNTGRSDLINNLQKKQPNIDRAATYASFAVDGSLHDTCLTWRDFEATPSFCDRPFCHAQPTLQGDPL